VVLCYLDGRTTEHAAEILGCPRGTVLSRLSTARDRLRDRLTRRGLALPVSGIAALFIANESPATLVPAAVRAALAGTSPLLTGLVQGVFHAMLLTKVKIATAVVLTVGIAGAGVGWVVVPGSGPAVVQADEPKQPAKTGAPAATTDPLVRLDVKAIDETLKLLLEAKRTLGEQLEQAEQEHQDFRLKNPFPLSQDNRRARIETIDAKLLELRMKTVEIQTRLSFLKGALKDAKDEGTRNLAAMSALQKLQFRGVDVRTLRNSLEGKLIGDTKEGLEYLVVRAYVEGLESELLDNKVSTSALDDLRGSEIKTLKEISNYDLKEERLRNAVIQRRKLVDAITKQLQEITIYRHMEGRK